MGLGGGGGGDGGGGVPEPSMAAVFARGRITRGRVDATVTRDLDVHLGPHLDEGLQEDVKGSPVHGQKVEEPPQGCAALGRDQVGDLLDGL